MKTAYIKKQIEIGITFGQEIRKNISKDDMKIVRCILGNDEKNIDRVMKFLNISSYPENKIVKIGIWIELHRQ